MSCRTRSHFRPEFTLLSLIRTPLHCAASCNNVKMVEFLVEHGACVFATTFSDHEIPCEKCDEDEAGFEACSQYLHSESPHFSTTQMGRWTDVYLMSPSDPPPPRFLPSFP